MWHTLLWVVCLFYGVLVLPLVAYSVAWAARTVFGSILGTKRVSASVESPVASHASTTIANKACSPKRIQVQSIGQNGLGNGGHARQPSEPLVDGQVDVEESLAQFVATHGRTTTSSGSANLPSALHTVSPHTTERTIRVQASLQSASSGRSASARAGVIPDVLLLASATRPSSSSLRADDSGDDSDSTEQQMRALAAYFTTSAPPRPLASSGVVANLPPSSLPTFGTVVSLAVQASAPPTPECTSTAQVSFEACFDAFALTSRAPQAPTLRARTDSPPLRAAPSISSSTAAKCLAPFNPLTASLHQQRDRRLAATA